MTATAAMITELRRMVDEPDVTTYEDDDLTIIVERYPLPDERGEPPYSWDTSTSPPTKDPNTNWIPTYDLNRAASVIWSEKASAVAKDYTYTADGSQYQRGDVVRHYKEMARHYLARRSARGIVQEPYPYVEEDRFQTGH